TLAEHWKAGQHSAEQERLFALLRAMLKDGDERVRLQAGHFLFLLNDPRSEPDVAKVRTASAERRLATAPLKVLSPVWLAGPFDDNRQGMKAIHAPEQGPIDVGRVYESGGKKVSWTQAKPNYLYDLNRIFGPRDHV